MGLMSKYVIEVYALSGVGVDVDYLMKNERYYTLDEERKAITFHF